MAEVVLFHHVLGLTPGVTAFADELRAAGHTVHTPDLFEGNVFESIDDGMAFEESLGTEAILGRGAAAAKDLPADLVYMGMSLGVVVATKLVLDRPGARGGVLFYGFLHPKWFGPWPADVPAQVHVKEQDPFVLEDDSLDVAREAANIEVFTYPGDEHFFAEAGHEHYDEQAAKLAKERTLAFLDRIG